MLPLSVFWCLYPDQISPAGLTTGLDHINTRLTAYNRSHIPLYGALHGPITWQPDHPGAWLHRVKSYWYIADTPGPTILGLPSSEKLAVVKMNCAITVRQPGTHPAPASTTAATSKPATASEATKSIRSTDNLIKEFPDLFKGIGWFPGEYKIQLHHDAYPVIHASRKCPIALCPKVKEHLNKMECLGAITCVDEPTDWVSSITYTKKANGELCLCLDPCDLNEAIRCNHHKTPNVEEVTHEFTHSCFFTKLDACHGYWSIILHQDCSLLTTFNSPFRRYHFLWLPFGLVCSQDIFQKKMDQILEECQGCIRIVDDITVHGHTEAEHDAHLWDLMQIAHKYDLVFNPQKTHMKAQAINFFGCLYDANSIHPDPGKVNAVHALPAPTNVTELQEFLGLVTYLSPFIPGLSTLTAPLQELLKKDTGFSWKPYLWHCFWMDQGSCHQWHHPQVLRPITSHDHTSWCLTGRPWCNTPAKWQTHSLCQQGPHWNWMLICKHRERDASCCLWSGEIPHLHLWMVLHDRIKPQATWIHLQVEPSRHACMATMHDIMPTGIWLYNPLLPW